MSNWLFQLKLRYARGQLRGRRSHFYYEVGARLRERVPLVTTLRKYETRARLRGRPEALAYLEMLRGFQSGSISAAMEHIATPLERTLMDASQTAVDLSLAEGFFYMAETVEKVEKMRSTLLKAVAYPVFLLILFSCMLTLFSLMAVPVLAQMLPPPKWPPLGRALYFISETIRQYGLTLVVALTTIAALFLFSLDRWTGDLRRKFDPYFPYNMYRDFSGALLLLSLATMMRSGVSLRTALERAQTFATPWMKWHVRRIMLNLARPNTPYFGQAFQTGVLSIEMSDRVQDASERRDPVEAFIRTGTQAIDQMTEVINKRAKVLNFAMMIVCGLVLALMFAGFMSTAMSLQSGIQATQRP